MTIPGKDLSNKDVEVRQQNDSSSLNAAEIAVDPQERAVLSKFDKFVMPQMALLVLFAYLDRTNIGLQPHPCRFIDALTDRSKEMLACLVWKKTRV